MSWKGAAGDEAISQFIDFSNNEIAALRSQ